MVIMKIHNASQSITRISRVCGAGSSLTEYSSEATSVESVRAVPLTSYLRNELTGHDHFNCKSLAAITIPQVRGRQTYIV